MGCSEAVSALGMSRFQAEHNRADYLPYMALS
jgi:hypothetical protein